MIKKKDLFDLLVLRFIRKIVNIVRICFFKKKEKN